MAWQLHYTSARRGPTGRAGFQFVAETPGLPDGVRAAVTPHLSYRPPPDAPPSPGDAELDLFPVALLYDRVGGRPLLLRCRYLGRDYSGRYGNFLGHAVVAEPDELEGLRPAELWRSPVWADVPASGAGLPEVDDLVPGAESAPEALAEWLAASGAGAYEMLAGLVDAVTGVLGRGHGRVVLVSSDGELIARWIAVVSYSLPVAMAARLSFLTYSADPDGAAQRLVGTTPDVWASGQHHASHAFLVDALRAPRDDTPGRFARTVAGCWRDGDFAGLDALGELALLGAAPGDGPGGAGPPDPGVPDTAVPDTGGLDSGGLDRAAALLALCRGGTSVTRAEEDAAAGLLAGQGGAIPEWVWRDLVPGVPSMGVDLALAVHDRARAAGAAGVAAQCALRATELALGDPAARSRLAGHGPAENGPSGHGPAGHGPAEGGPSGHGLHAAPAAELAPRVAAALAAAPDLTEVAAVAAVADRAGAGVDPAEVEAAAADRAGRGAADLPAALDACPAAALDAFVAGALQGLSGAATAVREAALTGAACDRLHEHPERLRDVPPVALTVLASIGRRHRDHRVAITGELLLLDVPPAELDAAFGQVWAAAPSAGECLELLDAHAGLLRGHPVLSRLPSRAFARLAGRIAPPGAEPGGDVLAETATLRLAARVRSVLPGGPAERDAAAVQAYTGAVTAERPGRAAAALDALAGSDGRAEGDGTRLAGAAFTTAARRLARRPPAFRAALLAAASGPVRTGLGRAWTADLPGRARSGRTPLRGAVAEQCDDLVEVVLRLRARGGSESTLEAWAGSAAAGWFSSRRLDARLSGHPALRAALKELVAEARDAPGRGR